MDARSLALVSSACLLVACGEDASSSVTPPPVPKDAELISPSPDEPEPPPAITRYATDRTSAEVDDICATRARASAGGRFTAFEPYPIAGAIDVSARIEGEKLLLDFHWPDDVFAVSDQQTQWVTTLALEGAGAGKGEKGVRKIALWDEGVASRTCNAAGITRSNGARRLLAPDAELEIFSQYESAIYGRVTMNGAVLDFDAPLAASPIADENVCCVKSRPGPSVTMPVFSSAEVKALCAVRDAAPPIGALTMDPGSDAEGAVDVTVLEDAHPFMPRMIVHVSFPRTKPKLADGSPSETSSFLDWYFDEKRDAAGPPRLLPGRYTNGFGASGGQTCTATSGSGGSSTFRAPGLALVIDKRDGNRIEGTVETPRPDGTVLRTKFATVVNPPPALSLCCLDDPTSK